MASNEDKKGNSSGSISNDDEAPKTAPPPWLLYRGDPANLTPLDVHKIASWKLLPPWKPNTADDIKRLALWNKRTDNK